MSDAHDPLALLSKRERQIAAKFASGMTHREIGTALFIAPATVRTHLAAIYRKLGVGSKLALARLFAAGEQMAPSTDGSLPVLAILPFENLGGDSRWDRLADGLWIDAVTDLAREPTVRVIARRASLPYRSGSVDLRRLGKALGVAHALEGNVQTVEGQVRVTARLADCRNGVQVWAARYQRSEGDLLTIQDEIAAELTNMLSSWGGKLSRLRREQARAKPHRSLAAYELYLLGLEQKHTFTAVGCESAVVSLERAVELDPGFARAWIALGLTHLNMVLNGFASDWEPALQTWRCCVDKAVVLDPTDPVIRACAGDIRAIDGDLVGALREYEPAVQTAPNHADTLALVAGSLALASGSPERAVELARRALKLNPYAPSWYYLMLARAEYVVGNDRAALDALRDAPSGPPATLLLTALAHARIGEAEPAAEAVARLRGEHRDFSLATFIRGYPVTNPPALAAIRAGAEAAGLSA